MVLWTLVLLCVLEHLYYLVPLWLLETLRVQPLLYLPFLLEILLLLEILELQQNLGYHFVPLVPLVLYYQLLQVLELQLVQLFL
jgi:hypothetical protein